MPLFSGGAVIRDGKAPLFLDGEGMLCLSLLTEKSAGRYLPPTGLPDGSSVSFEILADDIEWRGNEIRQSCVLSPAEVSGDVTDEEMKLAAEKL